MGLSSSQARLLHLTSRMHQIEHKAAKVQAEKLQMANESDRVHNEYLNALEATKIQYSTLNTDGSVTYLDATYSNLCMGFISNGVLHSSPTYLGNYSIPEVTGTITGQGYQLTDSASGRVYVPQYVQNIYNHSTTAEEFAENMINYINGDSTIGDDTTTGYDTLPVDKDIELKRGDYYGDIIIKNGINVKLIDPVEHANYQITTNEGDEAVIKNIHYMDNGRLFIEGRNLRIIAAPGQDDNIILVGDENYINTGDGNDRIRAGYIKDSYFGDLTVCASTIVSGSGDDYVEIRGKDNKIYGETGTDDILFEPESVDTNNSIHSFENQVIYNKTLIAQDGDIDWSLQGYAGNCRTLALINSLLGNLSPSEIRNYVTIVETDDDPGYKVEFVQSRTSMFIEKDYLERWYEPKKFGTGDLDTIIIEEAMRRIMPIEDCPYNDIAQIIFGNDNVYCKEEPKYEGVAEMFAAYQAGDISNFIVGTGDSSNTKLGIIPHHAYSVKNVDYENKRVELVNPWDSNDSITIDDEMFNKYFRVAFVFGETEGRYRGNGYWNNEEFPAHNDPSNNPLSNPYQYYIDLFNMLSESGMIAIPEGMETSTEWLANVIASGAVLKKLDTENNCWFDTSVAVDPHLQEVQDKSLLRQVEAKYESDMRKIDRKERKYDADLATLDNERNAIKQEMETLKNVAKENVERTFRLFS